MNGRKYVSPLSPSGREQLLNHESAGSRPRRHRLKAKAIRLSAKGFAINEMASACEQSCGTISRWIERWESGKPAFFTGRRRSGRSQTPGGTGGGGLELGRGGAGKQAALV